MFPGLSRERLFCLWTDDGQVRTRTDRAEVAARLGRRAGLQRPEPGAGRRGREALVPARDAAVPVREEPAHGARLQLHDGRRRHALPPPQRRARAAADGLGRLRPAGGERGDPRGRPPARHHRSQHRPDPRADAAPRVGDRLGPRGLVARSPFLQVDAVAVPALLRARSRVPPRRARQLVPERPDGDRERVRRRWTLRALRRADRAPQHDAMVLQDHRVRGRAARVRASSWR